MEERVIIIGAGHGGSQAAASLRQEGFAGRISLVNDETELPYHKPPLSKTFLKTPDGGSQMLRPESFYRDNDVDLVFGRRVASIDRQAGTVALDDGSSLPFSHIVLATGARPRLPQIEGVALDGIFALRNFADAGRIRQRTEAAQSVVIVGGGFIGMEIAHTLAGLGKQVTLLEMAPRVLGRSVAPAISIYADARARAAGIDLKVDIGVASMEGSNGHVAAVRLADGSRIPADLVILGTGVVPNVELAADAGLEIANGIVVDEALRTADHRILALGDAASFHHWHAGRPVRLESVQNASDQAKHAARTITGKAGAYRDVPWFWSDQGDIKLQTAGLSLDADRFVVSGNPDDDAFSVWHFSGPRLLAVDSINRAADHMIARKLLAAGVDPSDADIAAGAPRLKELALARP
ncbi:FAD-dependent oxidoreductase [Mesorhizobium sp. YIM 152430]|uniref:NAD(P)/FAD-dependent oxidoreductase n=2 Tax=Mesorhizobium sp. YIM 152430 TaxID=3031761 RepID=UPI0023DA7E2B|nr:FAD-dependent oxidoreductase [Mesorhizobium sp. YIM 152430]MDF1600780.1 FAD-dependent oxidoreductase [Mesorhizobium sp. YIM 152430]